MILRLYQKQAADAVLKEWEEHQSTLVVMPTGTGKSLVMTELVRRLQPKRAIILVHFKELAEQTLEHLREIGLQAELELADKKASTSLFSKSPVIVAGVQTMIAGKEAKRMLRFKPEEFGLLIIDEAHRYVSKQWMSVVNHFKSNANLKVAGFSVSPTSYVELKGGCFGRGFVGDIESAFVIAGKIQMPHAWFDFEVIELKGVYSRGWTGSGFGWKPCLRILRHQGRPCVSIIAQGARLEVTPDHSIYEAVPDRKIRITMGKSPQSRVTCGIRCRDAVLLSKGDILVGDDGAHFDSGEASHELNMLEFCRLRMPASRVSVVCDVTSIDRSQLRHIANPKTIYNWRQGGGIPLQFFMRLANPPPAICLRVEGSSCFIAPTIRLCDWAYVLGFYLGDGWVSSDPSCRRLGFAVGIAQKEAILAALRHLSGVGWTITQRKMPGQSVELRANNIFVANILLSIFGEIKCYDKFIPGDWIVDWTRAQRLQLLSGLMDSDGYESKQKGNRILHVIVTTSKRLAQCVCSLLRSLGMWGTIHERKLTQGGMVDGRRIQGRRIAYQITWSPSERKGHFGKRRKFQPNGLEFTEAPVRRLETAPTPAWVYDLEIGGHPSFVADGVLVHNTATPDRLDGKALGKIFDSTAYQYRMTQSIQDGWLIPVEQDIVTVGELDFSKVHASGTDLNECDLAAVMEDEKPLIKMVEASLRIIGSKKFIGFTASVRHAQMCADIFNRPRPNLPTWKPNMAACISGETPAGERILILKDFKSGRLQGLLNVGVFVEGFNVPDAEVVLMAKPTLSRARYTQMVGRVLRPLKGILEDLHSAYERKEAIATSAKPVARVIDFVGNSGRHKLIHCQDVLGGDYSDEVIARAKQMAAEADSPMRVSETLEKSEEEIRARMEAQRLADQARKAKITASDVTFTTRRIDPFDILDIKPVREQGWDKGKIISEKMAKILVKMGVTDPYELPYGQARQLLNAQFGRWNNNLATLKQVETLKKRGIDAKQMTAKEASMKIDEIAAREGWKKKEAA